MGVLTRHPLYNHDNAVVIDSDAHFVVDPISRNILVNGNPKLILLQYDHDSERYSFDVPRIVDGHDLLDCDRIQVHYTNISASGRNTKSEGVYLVLDAAANPDDDSLLTFTWLVSEQATQYNGVLNFAISFECTNGEGEEPEVEYRWSTAICTAISIAVGLQNNNEIVQKYFDELLYWENYIVEFLDSTTTEFRETVIPELVDEAYVEREFATTEEIAAIFDLPPIDEYVEQQLLAKITEALNEPV